MILSLIFILSAVCEIVNGNDAENVDCDNKGYVTIVPKYESESDYAENTAFLEKKYYARGPYENGDENVKTDLEYEENSKFPFKIKEEAPLRRKKRIGRTNRTEFQQPSGEEKKTFERGFENENGPFPAGNETSYYVRDKLCRVCRVKFRFATHYEQHFAEDHPNAKPYACPCCLYQVRKRSNYLAHIKSKHPGVQILSRKSESYQIFECETCRTKIRGVNDFERHNVTRHRGVKMIKCGLCDARFTWFVTLTSHEMEKHGMHDAEFQCARCKTITLRTDELEKHVLKCEKRQAWKKHLANELEGNMANSEWDNERKVCYVCGEKFENFRLLHSHFRCNHPNVKGRFKCKICQKLYTSIRSLDKHADKVHADKYEPRKALGKNEIYECRYCGEIFQSLKVYEDHGLSAHGKDQKPFHCPECGAGFNRKRYLRQHVKKHRKNETLVCRENCARKFWTLYKRKKHEITCGKKKRKPQASGNEKPSTLQ